MTEIKSYASRLLSILGLRDALKSYLLDMQESYPFLPFKLDDSDAYFQLHRIMTRSKSILKELNSQASSGPNILFAHMRGSTFLLSFETLLAHRLRFDGAMPTFLACEDLPQCNNRSIWHASSPNICDSCLDHNTRFLKQMRLPFYKLSDFVNRKIYSQATELTEQLSIDACRQFAYRDIPIGELSEVSVARYLCHDAFEDNSEEALEAWRNYLAGAVVLVHAYEQIFERIQPDIVFMSNGRFFWYSIAHHFANRYGARVVSYESDGGFGKTWIFRDGTPVASLQFSDTLWSVWKDRPLTKSEEHTLDEYLLSRTRGTIFYPDPEEDARAMRDTLKLPDNQPLIVMFTNLSWDSQVVGRRTVFNSMLEWVRETIRFLASQNVTVVLRVHPAEQFSFEGDKTRERAMEDLNAHFDVLPDNLRVIPPDSQLSSYTLLDMADAVVVYTSTIGLEALIRGRSPVIVGGRAHYWDRGFGCCPETAEEYFQLLENVENLSPPSEEEVQFARRYAYLFWFRTVIPLQLFETKERFEFSRFNIQSLEDIRPGQNPYLDLIADGVLGKKNFVLEEVQTAAHAEHLIHSRR